MLDFNSIKPTPAFQLPDPLRGNFTLHLARELVTVGEWNEFVRDSNLPEKVKEGNPTLPVTYVSWYEAVAYCKWFSSTHNVNARLPHEWELCLAERFEDIENYSFDGWPHESIETARFVGKRYNDIVCRAHQWCADGGDSNRVFRGGDWNYAAPALRASVRYWDDPFVRDDNLGFRLAFDG